MFKNCYIFLIFFFLGLIFICSSVEADSKPIQLALMTPIQIFPKEEAIGGFRLNILYGKNTSVTGFDLGLVNHTTEGISRGAQFGFLNMNMADYYGWQLSFLVNMAGGTVRGLQMGIIYYATHVSGVQFGFINYVGTISGIQIGLVNIIEKDGAFSAFPIVNGSF